MNTRDEQVEAQKKADEVVAQAVVDLEAYKRLASEVMVSAVRLARNTYSRSIREEEIDFLLDVSSPWHKILGVDDEELMEFAVSHISDNSFVD